MCQLRERVLSEPDWKQARVRKASYSTAALRGVRGCAHRAFEGVQPDFAVLLAASMALPIRTRTRAVHHGFSGGYPEP